MGLTKSEEKGKTIIKILIEDLFDGVDSGPLPDRIIQTLTDNNLAIVNAELFDEMSDLCGAAMDELWDHYENDEQELE